MSKLILGKPGAFLWLLELAWVRVSPICLDPNGASSISLNTGYRGGHMMLFSRRKMLGFVALLAAPLAMLDHEARAHAGPHAHPHRKKVRRRVRRRFGAGGFGVASVGGWCVGVAA